MKIRRPPAREGPFKRNRGPPPQATKLLTYSVAAGIVFMVLLAIVSVPRMFPDQTPIEIVRGFHFETPNTRTLIYVDSVTVSLELSRFQANFSVDGSEIARLGAGLGAGNATLRFFDASANGLLDPGDYFEVSPPPAGCYRLVNFQLDVGRPNGLVAMGAMGLRNG